MGERSNGGFGAAWRLFRRGLAERIAPSPIRDDAALAAYLGTRAAKVAQAALFGYLKTRMGTQARYFFQDEGFSPAIKASQRAVFFAALEDLVLYAVAQVAAGRDLPPEALAAKARWFFFQGPEVAEAGTPPQEAVDRLTTRLETTRWLDEADPDVAFGESARVLIDAAPVSEAFRRADRDVVDASMRYRWIEVRREFRTRIDAAAVAGGWAAGPKTIQADSD